VLSRRLAEILAMSLAILALACVSAEESGEPAESGRDKETDVMSPFAIKSADFDAGAPIPRKHTGEGPDVSPGLAWSGVPEGTREFALICDDPDAPRTKPWVHWVFYGIPPQTNSLPEGVKGVGVEGRNDFGRSGYGGPMPPKGHGTHHYHFKLYALDAPVTLEPGAMKEELLAAMKGHVLGEAELIGTYERE
jgi:Raf kinase inhibitor-like YbhB/YbcL family protein